VPPTCFVMMRLTMAMATSEAGTRPVTARAKSH
jgi:hypothetical protein